MSVTAEGAFLDKLQNLLAEGSGAAVSTTYKFAVLLGLTDLAVERPPADDTWTTRQLAERVVELYWRQALAFPETSSALRQSRRGQSAIIKKISDVRTEVRLGGRRVLTVASLAEARPEKYESLIRLVEWKLIEMPLPRLQRLRAGEDRFIYDIAWTLDDVEPDDGRMRREVAAYQQGRQSDFHNAIQMRPGVVALLARFHWLIRELIEERWTREVHKMNAALWGGADRDLRDHLFGSERAALQKLREPLRALQHDRCFYYPEDVRLWFGPGDFRPWVRTDALSHLARAARR